MDTPRTDVPQALVGKWYSGTVSSVDFYDPGSGSWGDPSGNGLFLTLVADGTFSSGYGQQVTLYDCETSSFFYKAGTVTVTGTDLTLYPNSGSKHYLAICSPSLNEDRGLNPDELNPIHQLYQLQTDDSGQPVLVFTLDDGSQLVLRPAS
jgi:hypothetical protein